VHIDAIVFDLGNTLVPWDEPETQALYEALREPFEEACGPLPDFIARARRARDTLITERENGNLREVTAEEFVEAVSDGRSTDALVDRVAAVSHEAFVALCRVPPDLPGLLDRLGRRYPLAVLSNFFLDEPVHDLLQRAGLAERFVHVEVSATSGYMKPHPIPFEIVVERLGTAPERTLMVGDNFYADIVGGHRAGLRTALTVQHRQGPRSDPRAPEVRADLVLGNLRELEDR
jgi:putative hydrolase of the HAD superfamily